MNEREKVLRVLIIEDSEDDSLFVARELKRGGFEPKCERVETLRSLASALLVKEWDLIISDHSMPSWCVINSLMFRSSSFPAQSARIWRCGR